MKATFRWLFICTMLVIAACSKEDMNPVSVNTEAGSSNDNQANTLGKAPVSRAYSESFTATSGLQFTATGVFNPGGGTGNATHLGGAQNFFNQQVLFDANFNPIGSVPAPVNQFYATQLAAVGITNIPNTVSAITFDKQGNSVWFTSNTGNVLTPVSASRVNFTAPLTIIGGTGKFAGATGQVTLSGYFDPNSPSQAAVMQSSGTIQY